jgi:hypothetical protein
MKKLVLVLVLLFFASPAFADYVNGYYKKNGTYVNGYHRTHADSTRLNNYSTKGNYNPYTGQKGYKDPYSNSNSYSNRRYNNSYRNRY